MKRIASIGLCLLLFLAWAVFIFPPVVSAIEVDGLPVLDEGSVADLGLSDEYVGYFGISSADELFIFADEVRGGNKNIKAVLLCDIVINESLLGELLIFDPSSGEPHIKSGASVREWTPIESFSGVLDGGGHGIYGLYIKSDSDNTALISTLEAGGVVRNLKILDSYIYSHGSYTGSAVGENHGIVSRVENLSDVASGGNYVGGIVGNNLGEIYACSNSWNVQGDNYVGGIAGRNSGKITHSYSAYSREDFYIFGSRYIGGIVGENFGTIEYCYSAISLLGEAEVYPIAGSLKYGSFLKSNYYFSDTGTQDAAGCAAKAMVELESGEVTYLLNLDGEVFYQTVGVGMPAHAGKSVYLNRKLMCPGDDSGEVFYSNQLGDAITYPEHLYSGQCDRFCNICEAERNALDLHTFVDNCDEFCDVCSEKRIAPHVYDNECDNTCNGCDTTREVQHNFDNDCDADCSVCGHIREVAPHLYSYPCDTECNLCGAENSLVIHTYTDNCDGTCEHCDATRDPIHIYDNLCDSECNSCHAERQVEGHKFDNNCDTSCHICGYKRETEHDFAHPCDEKCDVCGAEREVEHNYSNVCDDSCNLCGATRLTDSHKYDNECDADCNLCGAVRTATNHKYKNECDTDCDICGFEREAGEHKYENGCDFDCNICGATRDVDNHKYSTICDTDCGVCGEKREAAPHEYDSGCDSTCNLCGQGRVELIHTYDNACDRECNVCELLRETEGHSFGDYSVKLQPTITKDGEQIRRCSSCGFVESGRIPATGLTTSHYVVIGVILVAFLVVATVVILVIFKARARRNYYRYY